MENYKTATPKSGRGSYDKFKLQGLDSEFFFGDLSLIGRLAPEDSIVSAVIIYLLDRLSHISLLHSVACLCSWWLEIFAKVTIN